MPGRLRIEPDFGYVETPEGTRITLTAAERRVLQFLRENPDRPLTRGQILDVVSEPGSEKSDRNVDFLINRLRRKLSDDARNPRYIATRYGEGYVWIAGAAPTLGEIAEADVVFGPILGIEGNPASSSFHCAARKICTALSAALEPETRVIFAADCPPVSEFGSQAPTYSAELAFFLEGNHTSCVITLREFRSGRAEAARRFDLGLIESGGGLAAEMQKLIDQGWLRRIGWGADKTPLPVSVEVATTGPATDDRPLDVINKRRLSSLVDEKFGQKLASVLEAEQRLRRLLDETPGDAELKLFLAVTLHSKYVSAGPKIFATGPDRRAEDEDAIEELVIEALPYVRSRPEHVIMCGKLLHFLQRGYDDLGRELCESAYAQSVSVGQSLAVIGQMRSFFGDTEGAIQCLDQALNFSAPGSHGYLYALIIKCQTLAADANWDALRSARRELLGANRLAGFAMEPLFCDPDAPTILSRAAIYLLPKTRARGVVMHAHYVGGRLFSDRERGRNMMRCICTLVARRHGVGALPEEVTRTYPTLVAATP